MQSFSPKHSPRRLRLSPLSVLAVGLAVIATCIMAAHPPTATAQGNAVVLASSSVTPPSRTPPMYPNTTQAPITGIPAIQATNGGPITEADVMTFVKQYGIPHSLSSDRGTVVNMQEETESQVAATLQNLRLPDATLLWVVELSGHFMFAGSSQQTDGLAFPYAFEVFIANTGNLIMAGGLDKPLPTPPSSTPTPVPSPPTVTPTAQPTATPTTPPATAVPTAPPTPTTVPQHPPILSVRPMATTEDCAGNSYPNFISVLNSGSGTLIWSATAPSGVALTPSHGALTAGASQTIMLNGSFTAAPSFVLPFTSNGGSASVTITCQRIG